jgi:antirestriction protein ArdC
MPKNAATGRHYSGINVLILWGAVVAATGTEPERLLSWILAWTGLSAASFIG